ncbi:uncharacterized protein C8Q71DRAFT_794695 [Rhodofomes roseus]|uniref:AB hydrolase-1 domain-containing protein n=1 Tax=Rhodofomes roseus TaxID=34475 RepID=A0ABQ8KU05_9APHY|nr:uncharacterized protein C8Q71DRAFT_353094 [Rhodofomes roseus]XP_047783205.1 uncharacterized protein C8Q71DRAFT_794695 [Rhodofomes roseus]KAH9841897.1 hypothetical protein C8Q71DRAFT_353094 [Rhodofomes roseus]KAH9841906.1 hypothetical protein C8Q71DRAFT_794695 [Rhodofomes roseus]
MPHHAVDGGCSLLYYEDSGAPAGSADYVTVFLVHGTMFSSAIFRRVIPCAARHDLRLVLINCRDYPGSTLYSASELRALSSPDPATQGLALQARGLEFAEFIRRFIEMERIPPITVSQGPTGVRRGGFSLLGWSSGNCQTIPLLAYAHLVPNATRRLFDAYFRSFVMYDISLPATGETPISGIWTPLRDSTLSAAEKFSQFSEWVSYYFTPTGFGASDDIDTPGITDALVARIALHQDKTSPTNSAQWMPTVHRIGPQKMREVCHVEVMARSQKYYQNIAPAVYRENVRRAVLQGKTSEGMVWPDLKVAVVWCDMSNSDVVSAAMKLKALTRSNREQGEGRDVAFHKLEKANHFAHWDDPESFTSFLARVV